MENKTDKEQKPTTDEIVSKYCAMERKTRTVNIKENNYENNTNDSNTSN